MIYLLDSNACIGYLNGRAVGVLQRLQAISAQDVVLCSIVKAELFYGAMKGTTPAQTLAKLNLFLNRFTSLPFDDRAAEVYGRIRARLSTMGTSIGPNDLFIASIAIANNVTLVTHNTREFSRIDELRVEDWELPA
jgi:tRNA(fMet)-specific endonuclease VapC